MIGGCFGDFFAGLGLVGVVVGLFLWNLPMMIAGAAIVLLMAIYYARTDR